MTTPADLFDGSHDLRRSPGNLLNGRRKLFGGRGQFGLPRRHFIRADCARERRDRLRRALALLQSRGLLFNASQRFGHSRGLFFGGRRNDLGALLSFTCGGFSFQEEVAMNWLRSASRLLAKLAERRTTVWLRSASAEAPSAAF